MGKGFTLIEVLIVLVMLFTLISAATYGYIVVLETWGSQDASLEIREDLWQGVERMLRDLRPAKAINVANDAIRYTIRESGVDNHYIFYLYHASDSWVPAYNQNVYQLRRTALSGGIGGTFTYGSGTIYIKEVKPPPTSDLSASGNIITIDLTTSKYDETFRLLEKIRPRNL